MGRIFDTDLMEYVPNTPAEWIAFGLFALLLAAAFGAQLRIGRLYIHLGWLALAAAALMSLIRVMQGLPR